MTAPIILVDGSSYLYRAFHALPDLRTSSGQPTSAVRGVVSMLKKMMADYQPTHMVVVFDAKGKTFRDDMYAEYKANRPPMPDDLREQIEPLYELVKALGLPIIVEPGVEADDVIGTLAQQGSKAGKAVLISTGDKDMAQLVDDYVTLINTMTDTLMNREGVVEKFGVPPERIIDYLSLIGDKVDNVPGVDKVGPKTAVKWLGEYDSLEGVMESAERIKGKVGENLREALDRLPLSKELVTIKCDCELNESLDDLILGKPDNDLLETMYTKLEFKGWLRELSGDAEGVIDVEVNDPATTVVKAPENIEYETIFTQKQFDSWLEKINAAGLVAFDTETTSLNYMQAELVGMSFCVEVGKAAYLPVAHGYDGAPEQLNRDEVLKQLKPWLEDDKKKKVGHHLKYDKNVLGNYGVSLNGIQHDTMLESYVTDSTASRHDMDTLSDKHLHHKTVHYEDIAGKGVKQITFDQIDLDIAAHYAAEDADITLRLHEHFWPALEESGGRADVYKHIEMPLVPVLSAIERTGVLIDADLLFQQSHELADLLAQIESDAHELAGKAFNLSSPKQLQEILFEEQGLPVIRKTPKGQPSTAEDVLEQLALDYPLPSKILTYRSLAKLKSTYTDKLPEQINPDTGRVHTSYHQAVASTGRLSSTDPNLQNIPIRTEEGRRIRQAFIAPEGYQLLAVDYSQIELRIMAHLSGDEGLLKAFAEGRDIHRATAAEVFGVSVDQVENEQRRAAKAINFGLIYGMSAFGLGKQLGIGRNEAQEYVDLYFARYPGVKTYMDNTREQAKTDGCVETVFGRRLYLPEINARNAQRRQYAERTAINAPMQGTAADIIKRAMIDVYADIKDRSDTVRMIMQVHDELVFEVKSEQLTEISEHIIAIMESAAELKVPLIAEAGVGNNWDEAH